MNRQGKYRDLLFDADNTLLDFSRAEHEAIGECFSHFGLCAGEEEIALYAAVNDSYWKRLERGEILKQDLYWMRFATYLEEAGLHTDADPREMNAFYKLRLSKKAYLWDGALAVCTALARTHRLYLITNGDKYVQEHRFDPSPLAPLFRARFISETVGAEKPSAAYFDAVKAAIPQFCAAHALVIGDSLTSDILGGMRAGIDTCWFNPHGKPLPGDFCPTYVIGDLRELVELVNKREEETES